EGLVEVDFSQAALAVQRRRSSLPRGIARSEVQAILQSCDRRRALGRRDYAMVLLLVRLGLRRGEVAALRLDDIDWLAGGGVGGGRPVPPDVGRASAAYLKRGRPPGSPREVFLTGRAPLRPVAPGTVASTVRRACRRAGIPEVGSHRLRHTTACDMVSAGVPLVQVAQVLRHPTPPTTPLYPPADLGPLRLLAAPWPGSVPA